jgi:hypothetical protein
MAADRFRGPFHLGQAAAVRADGDDFLLVELDQHAAEGVAAAFHVGGELGAEDDLLEQRSGNDMVFFLVERRDRGKLSGVFAGELEFAPLPFDDRPLRGRFDLQLLVAAFAEDSAEVGQRQDGASFLLHLHSFDRNANPNLHIGRHEDGPGLGHVELHVLQDRLGAAAGGEESGSLECGSQLLAVT